MKEMLVFSSEKVLVMMVVIVNLKVIRLDVLFISVLFFSMCCIEVGRWFLLMMDEIVIVLVGESMVVSVKVEGSEMIGII